jgi:hypothetical protein
MEISAPPIRGLQEGVLQRKRYHYSIRNGSFSPERQKKRSRTKRGTLNTEDDNNTHTHQAAQSRLLL